MKNLQVVHIVIWENCGGKIEIECVRQAGGKIEGKEELIRTAISALRRLDLVHIGEHLKLLRNWILPHGHEVLVQCFTCV